MLWGPNKNLDFWTARAAGLVPAAEQRAVSLLAKHSEERRFSLYCRAGYMPAMGNMTKRIYLIRRFTGVLELEDGMPRSSWCMNGGGRSRLPETDHVVAMKLMIEGEEYVFRTTGNPSIGPWWKHEPRFANPYEASFGGEECRLKTDEDLYDTYALQMQAEAAKTVMKSAFDRIRFRHWFAHKARLQQARYGAERDVEECQKGSMAFGNSAQIGITNGVFGGTATGIMFTGGTANLCTTTLDTTAGQPALGGIQGVPAQMWPPDRRALGGNP